MNKILIGIGIGIIFLICLITSIFLKPKEPEFIPDYCIGFKDFQVSESYNIRINESHDIYGLYIMNFTIENCGNVELTNIFLEYSLPFLVSRQKCCCIDSLLPNAEKRVSYVNWTGPYSSWCNSINPGCERSFCWFRHCKFFWTCDQLQETWKDRDPTKYVQSVLIGDKKYIMAYVNFWRSDDCSFTDQRWSF